MKARWFTALVLVVGLPLLVPGGAQPSAAQWRPAAPVAPALSPSTLRLRSGQALLRINSFEGPAPNRAPVFAALRSGPLMFIENVGQFDERARFQVRGDNATFWLAEDGLWVTVAEGVNPSTALRRFRYASLLNPRGSGQDSGHRLKLSFVGANPHPRLEPFNRLDTRVSYFVGSDPANWRADVPVWGGVRYVDLYPGLDLEVTGNGGRWAWRLVCRADCQSALQRVRLRVDGADALSLGGNVLRLTTPLDEYILPLLQVVGAASANLASPTITGDQVAFPFAATIPNPQLVLSPVEVSAIANPQSDASDLLYGTFLGGSSADEGGGITLDSAGNAYVTGDTHSSDFPTTVGAFDTGYSGGDTDAFLVKVNADGTGLVYATYLGGSNSDRGYDVAVDGAGNAYAIGTTDSSDFPTTAGAFDTSHNGGYDAFVVKLNTDGTGLAYATYLGGSSTIDGGHDIAVDGAGHAYVTGSTGSSDFPTTPGAFDTSYSNADAFVVKMNSDGTGLTYATLLGGSRSDDGYAIAVDETNSVYVVGTTTSSDFPVTVGAFDTSYNGNRDAFVAKVNADGTGLIYATYLGGSDSEWMPSMAVDGAGNAYVAGSTEADFPTTAGAFDTTHNGDSDAFVAKLNADGTGLVYATFLGGGGRDYGKDIAVDGAGNAYVTGNIYSSDFPTTTGAFDTTYNGAYEAFVAKLNADGTDLAYATFLGGSDSDNGMAIAVDGAGNAYVTGSTGSSDFPTTPGAFDTSRNVPNDAFVTKISTGEVPPTPPSPIPPSCLELISNGGFETYEGWTILDTIYDATYTDSVARSGTRSMRLGIEDVAGNLFSFSSIEQRVTIPGDASTARLYLWYQALPGDASKDYGYVLARDVGGGWRTLSIIRQAAAGWTHLEADLLPFAGQTIVLRFGVRNDGQGGAMAIYLDDVSLQVCRGEVPSPTPIPTATPTPTSAPMPTGTPPPQTSTPTPTGTPLPPPTPTPTQPPECPELIRNGGFETGEGWEIPHTPRPAAYTTAQVHSGSRAARLGIEDDSRNVYSFSSVQQVVAIPAEATGARLSFWYLAQKGESTDYGYIVLQDAGQVWRTLSIIRQPPSGWQRVEVDVSHYAGQTVLLRLGVRNDGQGGAMAIYLDDVSLQACQR